MIAVVNYDTLESLPPIMSLLRNLKQLGETVYFIGMASDAGEEFLNDNDIPYSFLPALPKRSSSRIVDYLRRAVRFFPRRRWLANELNQLRAKDSDLIVWFQQVKSAALLGNAAFAYSKRVITFFEIYDKIGSNWFGFDFKKFVATTNAVVPEYNRSWILKCHYNLISRPFVLENKPSPMEDVRLPETARKVFEKIGTEKTIVLYQGALVSDRKDVITVVETIAKHRPQYAVLVLANQSEEVERMVSSYENVYYHPLIAAPNHLAVTEKATVGIAVYNGVGSALGQLNAAYCAPNKIYEYAEFGLPTLGNNIPGIKYSVEAAGAGLCCEMSEESILSAVDKLVNEHDAYSRRAKAFYASCDTVKQTEAILNCIRGLK